MTQIATGLLLGITASLIAGLLLTWKGDKIVGYFSRLPERRRINLFTKAYILGLHSYPYRFLHAQALISYGAFLFLMLITYAGTTAISFRRVYFPEADSVLDADTVTAVATASSTYMPWLLLVLTLLLCYIVFRLTFRRLMPEILAPYGHHELMRVHDCVAKFGTKKQYLDYINAAHKVRDNAGLIQLLDMAQVAIGDYKYELVEEIRKGITPDAAAE